jgi:hypothetical protein
MLKFLVIAVLSFSSYAFAEEDGPCAKDRESLCKGVEHGKGRIMKCLKENKEAVSSTCKAHLETMKEHAEDVKEACKADKEKLCGEVKGHPKKVMKCMYENKEKLSAQCKSEIEEMKEARHKK